MRKAIEYHLGFNRTGIYGSKERILETVNSKICRNFSNLKCAINTIKEFVEQMKRKQSIKDII